MLLVPSLVTNVWQLLAGQRFDTLLRRLWPMMLGVAVGTLAGSGIIASTTTGAAAAGLGAALVAYAVVGLAKLRLRVPPLAERWLGPLVGCGNRVCHGGDGRVRHSCRAIPGIARAGTRRIGAGAPACRSRCPP